MKFLIRTGDFLRLLVMVYVTYFRKDLFSTRVLISFLRLSSWEVIISHNHCFQKIPPICRGQNYCMNVCMLISLIIFHMLLRHQKLVAILDIDQL